MTVLGIDPGYAIVGYAIVKYTGSKFTVVDYGTISTKSEWEFTDRLLHIYKRLEQIIGEHNIDAMAVEKLFFTTNQKTAMDVAHARGVIMLTARIRGAPVFEYTPLQVKQAVAGYGKAGKKQVTEMTKRLLSLKETPKPDDAADALAVAICHCFSSGSLLNKLRG
ncbi:MAG: crossover junction endodeoxyribonuclease RuvC [Oscillospiraceae bacterium]|nr:crossover junction endodeoxyribonuclease RuvC [Oscillospiraceae bacterium]